MTARTWRRSVQVLALVAFVALCVYATGQRTGRLWADLFVRLDPLLMIVAGLAGRVLLPGLVLAAGILLLTLLFGRIWCGWLCPLGSLLEWTAPRRSRHKPPSERWRAAKVLLLVAMLAAALLGSQALSFLDPLTILNRTLAAAAGPALRHAAYALEAFLYRFGVLWGPLDALHAAVVAPLFSGVQPVYGAAPLIVLLLAGLVALGWWVPRAWCRYLCPLGGLLALVARRAFLRREVGASCAACGRCARECPTGTIDPQHGFRSDPAECIMCLDCLECAPGSTSFRFHLPARSPAGALAYDPGRRQLLLTAAAAAAGVALAGVEPIIRREPPFLLRPPGAGSDRFLALCTRCGACLRACPTHGLQPGLLEGGLQGWMAPHLVPRLGFCDYGCTACGRVCPTGAVERLSLEDKQRTRIGLAAVDRSRCLPWAYGVPCIVCEEACPLPDKAIHLEEVQVPGAAGETILLQRPLVDATLCIGCGVCEFKCVQGGDAAIRVHPRGEAGL